MDSVQQWEETSGFLDIRLIFMFLVFCVVFGWVCAGESCHPDHSSLVTKCLFKRKPHSTSLCQLITKTEQPVQTETGHFLWSAAELLKCTSHVFSHAGVFYLCVFCISEMYEFIVRSPLFHKPARQDNPDTSVVHELLLQTLRSESQSKSSGVFFRCFCVKELVSLQKTWQLNSLRKPTGACPHFISNFIFELGK